MNSPVKVQDLKFLLIYVDELEPCQTFYETYLGFEKTAEFRPGEIYGKVGDVEMWLGSGYAKKDANERNSRATVMLGVDSVGTLYQRLQDGNEKIIQDAPIEMQPGVYWLQFVDPAGNVIDVLGSQ